MSGRHGAAHPAVLRRDRSADARGMVTVELAVGFVTATLLAATLAAVVLLGVAQAACARASSEMARQLARGDTVAAQIAKSQAPAGAHSRVVNQSDGVGVRVSASVQVLGIGAVTVAAENWAAWEPGVGDAAAH
ncbi:TadE family type IV pilus minor pilin [Tessaracoccus sp.]